VELLRNLEDLGQSGSRRAMVLTIGAFDGVHVAHQALISGAVMRARELGVEAVVLTFDPHPDSVIRPDRPFVYLTDNDDKALLVGEIGAYRLIIQPFTREFASSPPENFVSLLLELADIKEIHIGEDFKFGYKAQGNVVRLREWGHQKGFQVKSLAPLEVEGVAVSSSRIRQLLLDGEVAQAGRLLARSHSLKGNVVHSSHRGRLLGFPTANMSVSTRFAIPGDGVYATMTTFLDEGKNSPARPSVTNVGKRPTFDNGERSIETYVLDWSGDLYNQNIRVEFVQKLRDERKFSGIEEIKAQLARDVTAARVALEAAGRY
jgi:riboflavin kinase / FMN adenylyltransferase